MIVMLMIIIVEYAKKLDVFLITSMIHTYIHAILL